MAALHIPLRAGPLSAVFDSRLGSLRYLRVGNEEILRHIYAAIRDENWATIPVRIQVEQLEAGENAFTARIAGVSDTPPAGYRWSLQLSGSASGRIDIRFEGRAGSAFLRNRIGLCVLHPITGGLISLTNPGSASAAVEFPCKAVSPWQPATDISNMSWETPAGTGVRLEFSGELFEMEDQRNWGDHSLKTYCTPQHLPKPVEVRPGDEVRQSVRISITPPETTAVQSAALTIRPLEPVPKPRLGLLAVPDAGLAHPAVRNRLRELNLHHVRVDLRLREADWPAKLKAAADLAQAIRAELHAALFLTDDAARELADVTAATASLPVAQFLIFHERLPLSPAPLLQLARAMLGPAAPLAGGTDGLFCELNRNPPPPAADWLPCFSAIPQAHLTDEETMAENLPAIADALRTLGELTPQPVVVSPISLAPRFPADAWFSGALETCTTLPPDPRQDSPFGAAWLLGSIAWLCRATNLRAATLFPTHGPGGILTDAGIPKPPWHVLRFLADHDTVTPMESSSPLTLSALEAGGRRILANHDRAAQQLGSVTLPAWDVSVQESVVP